MSFTLPTPPREYDPRDQGDVRIAVERILRFLHESTDTLSSRGLTAKLSATVTNDSADLEVEVVGSRSEFPVRVRVYEDTPSGTPILDETITESETLTQASYPELANRTLPLRELRRWWVLLDNTRGVQTWHGPTAADRDALPYAAATTKDSAIKIEYDDDVDDINITLPNGATKVFTVSGGGTATYTVGDAVTTGSVEAALALDEVRDGYRVDVVGGGETRTIFRGALRGPKPQSVAASLKALVSNDAADLSLTLAGSASAFPVQWWVYEDTPDSVAIATDTAVAAATITDATVAAFGNRALPLRELRRWWVKTTDSNGATVIWGPTSADRDALPSAAVTAADSVLRVDYDDDTDAVKVTTPAGGAKVKTFSGLSGSGTVTYTVGDALDDASTEAALGLDEKRGTYIVEVQGGGEWRTVFRGKLLGPKGDNVTAKLTAAVTEDVADLTLVLAGSSTAFPVDWEVYEDVPSGSPIASGTAAAAETYSPGTTPAFDDVALPLREIKKWYVKTIDTHGHELWFGPTAADRDSLPNGVVTPLGPALKCEYDDDTDEIQISLPNGATKVFSGLSGGGTATYTIGDAVTTGSVEAALSADEERSTYVVTYVGGGESRVFYRGSLYGSNKDYTQGALEVQVTTGDDQYTFAYTAALGHSVQMRTDAGAWGAAAASPFDVTRNDRGGADKAIQLRVIRDSDSFEGAPRTFTVPAKQKVTCAVTSFHANRDSGTQMTISWGETGIPAGCLRYVSYSIDGAEQGNSNDDGSVTSPYVVTPVTLGATPSGTLTLSIEKDGIVLVSRTKKGLFTT